MTNPDPNGAQHPNGSSVSLREVYALVREVRADLSSEIRQVKTDLMMEFQSTFSDHETQHVRDANHRTQDEEKKRSLIRWAVTSIMTGIGVITAIVLPFILRQIG